MSSLSSWVRLLPGVQPDLLDATESLDAWHAKLERRIATRTQELADLQRRLEDSRSRLANLIASKWTAAQLKEAQAVLDAAVREAYGAPSAQDPVEFLLELNLFLVEDEALGKNVQGAGLPMGLDPKDPRWFSTDCIEPPPAQ